MIERSVTLPVISPSLHYLPALVNASLFDQFWRSDDSYLVQWLGGPRAEWFRYDAISSTPAFAVSLASLSEAGAIGLTNGRHRMRWLLQLQLEAIPIGIPLEELELWNAAGLMISANGPFHLSFTRSEIMNFDEGERAYLAELRAFTTDQQGRETFVGLSVEESVEYLALSKGSGRSYEAGQRYLALHERHERARQAVLAAENQLRVDRPSRH